MTCEAGNNNWWRNSPKPNLFKNLCSQKFWFIGRLKE
jgi:hypothetical protein